jgi:hypothetical protein
MFVRSGRSAQVALSAIVSMRSIDGGWLVTDRLGSQHNVSDFDWKLATELAPTATLPALPGTYALQRVEEANGQVTLDRMTVLGWTLDGEGIARPVIYDVEASISPDPLPIEMPDGHVEAGASRWKSADDWLADREQ